MDFDITNLMCIVRDKAKASRPEGGTGQQEMPCSLRWGEVAKCCSTHLPNKTRMDSLPVLSVQPKRTGHIVKEQVHLSMLLLNIITLWTRMYTLRTTRSEASTCASEISLSSPAAYVENKFVGYFLYCYITQPNTKKKSETLNYTFFWPASVTVHELQGFRSLCFQSAYNNGP